MNAGFFHDGRRLWLRTLDGRWLDADPHDARHWTYRADAGPTDAHMPRIPASALAGGGTPVEHDGRGFYRGRHGLRLLAAGGFLLTAPTDRPDEWRMDWNNMPFDVSADRFEPIRAEDLAPAREDASHGA